MMPEILPNCRTSIRNGHNVSLGLLYVHVRFVVLRLRALLTPLEKSRPSAAASPQEERFTKAVD